MSGQYPCGKIWRQLALLLEVPYEEEWTVTRSPENIPKFR